MDKKKTANSSEYLNVQKAADLLGVHAGYLQLSVHFKYSEEFAVFSYPYLYKLYYLS